MFVVDVTYRNGQAVETMRVIVPLNTMRQAFLLEDMYKMQHNVCSVATYRIEDDGREVLYN